MSAIKYKSKISVPGVELGNNVVLTAPAGRLNAGKSTTTNHTRDNDVLTLGHLVNCTIELWEDDQIISTGGEANTTETWISTETRTPVSVSQASSNLPYLTFSITETEYKSKITFNSITMNGVSSGVMDNQSLGRDHDGNPTLIIRAGFINATSVPTDYSASITFDKTSLL